jgi:O-antigen ligase
MENFSMGGLKFTYVWKFPILILFLINNLGQKIDFNLIFWGYLFALKTIFNTSFFIYPVESIITFSKYLVIPLFVHWICLNTNSIKKIIFLKKIPVLLAIFAILANVLFFLGVFPGPTTKPMLYYEEEILSGFVGILGAAHYTSAVLAVASVVLLNQLISGKLGGWGKFLLSILLFLGFILLVKTFARTGWLMFLIGVGVLFFRKISRRNVKKIVGFSFLVVVGLVVLFQTNEGVRHRVLDERTGQEDLSWEETFGSGRPKIAKVYLQNLYESNLATYLLGMGSEASMRRYEHKTGIPLIAHNGVLQVLVDDGLLGILLYATFIFSMWKAISRTNSSSNQCAFAVFFMFLSCLVTQQANYFLLDVFLAIHVALVLIEDRINKFLLVKKIGRI